MRIIHLSVFSLFGFMLTTIYLSGLADNDSLSIAGGVALFITAGWAAFAYERPFDLFGPAYIFNIVFSLWYGMATISLFGNPSEYFIIDDQGVHNHVLKAVIIAYWSFIFFNLGYFIPHSETKARVYILLDDERSYFALFVIYFTLSLVYVIARISLDMYFQVSETTSDMLTMSAIGALSPMPVVSLIIPAVYAFKSSFSARRWSLVFTISFLIFTGTSFASGSKTMMMMPIIWIAFVYNYTNRLITLKMAIASLIALPLVLGIVLPINYAWRGNILANQQQYNQSLLTSLSAYSDAASALFDVGTSETALLATEYFQVRMQNITIVSNILRRLEEGVTPLYGYSYFLTVVSFIPRFFWLDKPTIALGTQVTHEIFERNSDDVSSTGITLVGELVWNFGPFLGPPLALVLGLLMKWSYCAFRSSYARAPVFSIIVYSQIWLNMFALLESNFAICAAGAVKFYLMHLAVYYLAGGRASSSGGNQAASSI